MVLFPKFDFTTWIYAKEFKEQNCKGAACNHIIVLYLKIKKDS